MRARKCEVRIKADSVDVDSDELFGTKTSRLCFGTLLVALSGWLAYSVFFAQDRTRARGWNEVTRPHAGLPHSHLDLTGLVICLTISIFFLILGIRYLLPFGERLHCDHSTLTWSRIPWISFGNRWITRTVPFTEVVGASYAIVYQQKNVHGIVLETFDENWKMFWGIEPPEANRILNGLKKLGVNVHHDPEMRSQIRESLKDRRADL